MSLAVVIATCSTFITLSSPGQVAPPPAGAPHQGPAEVAPTTSKTFVQPVTRAPNQGSAEAIATAYLAEAAQELGVAAFERLQRETRRTRLGTWVPFALQLDGLPVLGATVIVHVDPEGRVDRVAGQRASARREGRFFLDAYDGLLLAARRGPRMGVVDPSTAREPGSVARALLDIGGALRPVLAVYPRSQHPLERYEVLIDAETGAVLVSRNRVRFASDMACGNVFNPTPGGTLDDEDVVETILPFAYADEDGYLKGSYFEIHNCCAHIGCDDYGEESRVQGSFPNPIGFGADPIYFDIVSCDEHPKAQERDGRFLYEPIDPPPGDVDYDLALADEFAEPAVYWTAQQLFGYVRQVGDPDFLLRDHGGTPEQPARGFHITVNMLFPAYEEAYEQIAPAPFGPGRGSEDNPVVIDNYMRWANAMYVPAITPGDVPLPIDLFVRDFDSVMMFQGETRDFGYDGDVVYHEMTHAVVGSTSNLGSTTMDEQGSLSSPSALNEGYADYFAATISNDSATGEYAAHAAGEEGGLRDADNAHVCPDDLTGEVHDDSWPWSGALWDLRDIFVAPDCDRARFDAAIYDAMVGLPQAATFDDASEATALALAQTYGRDSGAYQIARCVFARRGMQGCERVVDLLEITEDGTTLASRFEVLHLPSAEELAMDAAPSMLQLRADVPAGTVGLTLSWQEGAGGMDSFIGGTPSFDVLYKRGAPVRFQYSAGVVTHDADAQVAVTRTGGGIGTPATVEPIVLELSEVCGATYFFTFFNPGGGAVIGDIRAVADRDAELAATCDGPLQLAPRSSAEDPPSCAAMPDQIGDSETCEFEPVYPVTPCPAVPDPEPEPDPDSGCTCSSQRFSSAPLAALALAALLYRRRRAR